MLEMFYLNSTLNFGIQPGLVFLLEVYYKVDRLLTGLTDQHKNKKEQLLSNCLTYRNVLFEYHQAVIPFCWAVRLVKSLSTL